MPEAGLRELGIGPSGVAGLQVTRKVFVPIGGGFVRYLEVMSNFGESPVSVSVEIRGSLTSGTATRVLVGPADTSNTYAITDAGAAATTTATLGHVFAGENAPVEASDVSFADGVLSYRFDVTVPAGGTTSIVHFAVQREAGDFNAARAQVQTLVNGNGDAFDEMTSEELSSIVNFALGGGGE